MSVDNLQKYGQDFQVKCIVALLNDKNFLEQSLDVLDPTYFETESNAWIVEKIKWYYGSYKALPSVLVLKTEQDKIPDKPAYAPLKAGVNEALQNVFWKQKENPDDLKYVQDELLKFCKNQAIKNAVLKSADLIKKGDYDQIKVIIDKAMHSGQERNIGHVWLEDLDARINKTARNAIPLPWDCINQITDGGLGAGELGCIIAPSGIGKSWILAAIGAAAMKAGITVVHYTFELSETYVGLRYDTIFTGIEPNKIAEYPEMVKKAMEGISGNLFIKYFPTRSVNILALRAHYQKLCNLGHKPGLVVIDYADLMRALESSNAKHEELGYIYEEIRGFAGEFGLPVWTASQSQRSATNDDVVEVDKIAGAYAKIMACDVVLTASRKIQDKLTNTARIHLPKNRFGPDGLTFPAEMDLAHGIVNVFDENSPEGKKMKSKIASGEGHLKALLAKKFVEVSSEKTDGERPPVVYPLRPKADD